MRAVRYRLPDEPLPGGLVRYAVDPMWPLLSTMFAGNAIGMAWFAFNSQALGSPFRRREWAFAAGSLIGNALVLFALGSAVQSGLLERQYAPYAALALPAVKLGCAYALYISQSTSAELLGHFGVTLRNGAVGVFAAAVAAQFLFDGTHLPQLVEVLLR